MDARWLMDFGDPVDARWPVDVEGPRGFEGQVLLQVPGGLLAPVDV